MTLLLGIDEGTSAVKAILFDAELRPLREARREKPLDHPRPGWVEQDPLVVLDTVVRKLPGALGHECSPVEESFSAALEGAPEYPHYTRPAEWRGWRVPEVLLSGHHARIREWRLAQSRSRAGLDAR